MWSDPQPMSHRWYLMLLSVWYPTAPQFLVPYTIESVIHYILSLQCLIPSVPYTLSLWCPMPSVYGALHPQPVVPYTLSLWSLHPQSVIPYTLSL